MVVRVIMAVTRALAALVGIGWLGLQIWPKSFPPHPDKTRELGTIELLSDLPRPVNRHFKAILEGPIPKIETAVVWGRVRLKMSGLWIRVRFKAYYLPGQDFYHYMEFSWFGMPILRGYDSYVDGVGTVEIKGLFKISETGEETNQGQNITLWAEAVFAPLVFVTGSQVRWEALDEVSARLVVPFGGQEDSLLVSFDPHTGLMTQMSAQRYRGQEKVKTPWRVEYRNWRTLHSIKIPMRLTVTWEDESSPRSFWTIEGVEYNVDVSEQIPGSR